MAEARALGGLFKWSGRREDAPAATPAVDVRPANDVIVQSKVFKRFLSAVGNQPSPVILDLGPVVGSNISFFGERLACKIHVEDLYADVEAAARANPPAGLGAALADRLQQAPESIDGILCWDIFDFLDKKTGLALAGRLARLVRTGGALYGLFGTTPVDLKAYTRYVVENDETLRQKPYPATPVKRQVLMTRDIIKMFDGLTVAESVLLKSSTRETLFRKQ